MKTQTLIKARLTLLGAGPGDPELITLKGIKAIQTADVILYDALVNKQLLKEAKKSCKIIYVGKRKGKHSLTQEEINRLIVQQALLNGHVLRLKGGDPFVFGRGFEEAMYAENFGIPFEYIPGISSSIAAAGLAGIPVTHRGLSKSFHVLTASTENGKLNDEIYTVANSISTAVILMGLSHLKKIVEVFSESRDGNTGIAIVSNAGLKNQQINISKLKDFTKEINTDLIPSPAVIIIGDVVKLSYPFRSIKEVENLKYN